MGHLADILRLQADYLLLLHGLAFALMGTVCLALARLERGGVPWRLVTLLAWTWAFAEWLEIFSMATGAGPAVMALQMLLQVVGLTARAEFSRRTLERAGAGRVGPWSTALFLVAGLSGSLFGTSSLWLTLDVATGVAGLWVAHALFLYRGARHPGSLPLLVVAICLALYSLGTAVPMVHITWFLPGVAGGWPQGQLLWIAASGLATAGLMGHYEALWKERFGDRPVLPPGVTHARMVGAMALILAASFLAAQWGSRQVVTESTEGILRTVRIVAAGIDGERVRSLTGTSEDIGRPEYEVLEARLMRMVIAHPEVHALSSFVQRDGRVTYSLDARLGGSDLPTRPGTRLDEVPPVLLQVFRTGKPAVEGPLRDQRGTFVKAFAPIVDRGSGRVLQVVGADLASPDLLRVRATHRLVYLFMALLLVLLLAGAFTLRQVGWESEVELQLAELRYTDMFHSNPAVMLLIDPEAAVIRDANRAAEKFYGIPREQLLGLDISAISPMSREEALGAIGGIVAAGGGTGESEGTRPDGTRFLAEWESGPVRIGGRSLLFAIVHDITEKRRAEEGRKALEARMVESQKLESLGLLAGGVAHDFNNILQSILGNADLVLRNLSEGTPARRRLEGIRSAAERASDLCKLMLAYAGKGSFARKSLNLAELVREMVSMLSVTVPRKVALEWDISGDLPGVRGDPAQLRQVIMNLILNASEAIGDRVGTIAVRARAETLREPPDLPLAPGRYVVLEVRDTGCGMEEATRARIFEPFFSTKFTGRGLGLSAVQGIVRSHGGAVTVESEPGQGTTFSVYLPAEDVAPPGMGSSRVGEAPGSGPPGGTALLVDDEELVLEVGRDLLESLGFGVRTAASGEEALRLLREEGVRPRVVLLDATMPDSDGQEVFSRIRSECPDVPVVLISGFDRAELAKTVGEPHLAGFLQKPFGVEQLSSALAKALGESGGAGGEGR